MSGCLSDRAVSKKVLLIVKEDKATLERFLQSVHSIYCVIVKSVGGGDFPYMVVVCVKTLIPF